MAAKISAVFVLSSIQNSGNANRIDPVGQPAEHRQAECPGVLADGFDDRIFGQAVVHLSYSNTGVSGTRLARVN
jgi:hypothetical protein